MTNHSAYWRMPTPDQMEKLARDRLRTSVAGGEAEKVQEDGWWDAVLADPRAAGRPGIHISPRRLSEIPRELLRVECLKCFRTVEIQRLDAVKLYGPHAVWRDVGQILLDNGCKARTGSREDDGCWPDFGGLQ
jgi:hypothetical protein